MIGLHPRSSGAEWWASVLVIVLIWGFTLAGNLGVLVGLGGRRSPSHYPLISLVAADLLVGIAVQPLAAATELFEFKLNRYICGFWGTMDVLCCTASILSLCTLGWERWAGITTPLARARRAWMVRILTYSVWPVSALVALPESFVTTPHHFDPRQLEKGCPVNINAGYVFFSITLSFYLPAALMVVMYACIVRALSAPPPIRAHRGRGPNATINPAETNNNDTTLAPKGADLNVPAPESAAASKCSSHEAFIDRQRRATRTIVTLMALFLICWTPYFIILPLHSLYNCVSDSCWLWCTWLGYANSALNPLVYATRQGARGKRDSRSSDVSLPPARA